MLPQDQAAGLPPRVWFNRAWERESVRVFGGLVIDHDGKRTMLLYRAARHDIWLIADPHHKAVLQDVTNGPTGEAAPQRGPR